MQTIQNPKPKQVAPIDWRQDEIVADDSSDTLDDALALVQRVNERVRKSTETLTPTGVPRVA